MDRLGSSALVRKLVKEKENSEFKPVKLRLKIDLVSYPAQAEGLVNIYMASSNYSYEQYKFIFTPLYGFPGGSPRSLMVKLLDFNLKVNEFEVVLLRLLLN